MGGWYGKNEDPFSAERLRRLESAERLAQLPPEQLLDLLEVRDADTVLDLGAGGGYLTFPAAGRTNGTVYAVDADPEMRQVLNYRAGEQRMANVKVMDGRAEEIPLPDSSVDKAIASLVLHILDDPSRGVNELLRVMRPGGIGLIVEWAHPRGDGKSGHRIYPPQLIDLLQSSGATVTHQQEWADNWYSLLFRK